MLLCVKKQHEIEKQRCVRWAELCQALGAIEVIYSLWGIVETCIIDAQEV